VSPPSWLSQGYAAVSCQSWDSHPWQTGSTALGWEKLMGGRQQDTVDELQPLGEVKKFASVCVGREVLGSTASIASDACWYLSNSV